MHPTILCLGSERAMRGAMDIASAVMAHDREKQMASTSAKRGRCCGWFGSSATSTATRPTDRQPQPRRQYEQQKPTREQSSRPTTPPPPDENAVLAVVVDARAAQPRLRPPTRPALSRSAMSATQLSDISEAEHEPSTAPSSAAPMGASPRPYEAPSGESHESRSGAEIDYAEEAKRPIARARSLAG